VGKWATVTTASASIRRALRSCHLLGAGRACLARTTTALSGTIIKLITRHHQAFPRVLTPSCVRLLTRSWRSYSSTLSEVTAIFGVWRSHARDGVISLRKTNLGKGYLYEHGATEVTSCRCQSRRTWCRLFGGITTSQGSVPICPE
jgi:hypothetical protein